VAKKLIETTIAGMITAAVVLLGLKLINWDKTNWGKIQLSQAETITVIGKAKGQQKTQLARFTASVNKINDDKQHAIDEVNRDVKQIIDKVKSFGIPEKDIKTQTINIYQQTESYYEGSRRKTRPGQWSVSNTLQITLRDVDRASELSELLGKSGATNIYGPNFYTDETTSLEADLLKQAFKNAQEKAEKIAQASGKKLGKAISVTESGSTPYSPIRAEGLGGGGGGMPVEPGTSTIRNQVTAVFEIKD